MDWLVPRSFVSQVGRGFTMLRALKASRHWLAGAALSMACLGTIAPVQAADEWVSLNDLLEDVPTFRSESETSFSEHLETDRDSFTPAPSLVGAQRLMLESSYSFIDHRDAADSHSFPELLLRYGLTERFELRAGWNYEAGGGGSVSGNDPSSEESLTGIEEEASLLFGVKLFVSEQEQWIPESAVIIQANTPTAGPDTATQFTTGYVLGWELPGEIALDAALRYVASSEEGDHFTQWAPSVVVKVPLSEQWNAHVEYFGLLSDGRSNERVAHYVSPGVHYLITPDCEIGVRVGWGLTDDAAAFFSNVGLGYRF